MRVPILHQLKLLFRRSPETEYERVMLLHELASRRVLISAGVVLLLAGIVVIKEIQWYNQVQLECLSLNIYFEARGEPRMGQVAVAQVVMNRVDDDRFPGTVCAVVKQTGSKDGVCQFSWWCDRHGDLPRHKGDWELAQKIARAVYQGGMSDPTGGALWYHTVDVKPIWRIRLKRGPRIGQHIFYHDKKARTGA